MTDTLESLRAEYDALAARGLSLDLTRGKPSAAQLDLANGLLDIALGDDFRDGAGTDLRNYGGQDGLLELREIFGELLRIPASQLFAGGNASLQTMHDTIVHALLHGVPGGNGPWHGQDVAFLCPAPGYDRHFTMTENFTLNLKATDGKARLGEITMPRGTIRTPAFMPVGTVGTVKAMYLDQVRDAGADIILGNTYHLMLRPGAERVERLGGLHRFMGWDRPILTDSGGYQVMSLADLTKRSEEGIVFKSHLDGTFRSIVMAGSGRRVGEQEYDVLTLLRDVL